jgi:hypothetical protein
MEEILEFIYVERGEINGLNGPHVIVEGANLHVRSGSGQTDFPNCPGSSCSDRITGLGNLVVGYNEPHPSPTWPRIGIHNVIVGKEHEYTSAGGFVAGWRNRIQSQGSSVTGGTHNQAIGSYSSVSGGSLNQAIGFASSVSGGTDRTAPGGDNWAAGGLFEPN